MYKEKNPKYYKKPINLIKLIKRNALCDIWRKMHPDRRQYTWRKLSLKKASRLDFWLVSQKIASKVQYSDIRPAIRADHNAVSIKLHTTQNRRGPGYWKINTEILEDKDYKIKVKEIAESFSKKCLSPMLKWELFKIKIREFSQKFCRQKAVERKNLKVSLEAELAELDKQIDVLDQDKEAYTLYGNVRDKLEQIYKYESKGAGIRARARWMEEGERSNKYFLNLEKSKGKKKEINQLKCENGKFVNSNEDILEEVVKYYSALYQKEDVNIETVKKYVFSQNIDYLCKESSELCEGLLTEEECKRSLFAMQKNKAPGSDGISIEFYQAFWPQIKDFLIEALNECYITGIMSDTQRKGVITLLYKKGDCQQLKNWRPITLLNCDYKLIAAVLAARIQKVISEIVHENQTGYIKSRLAACNVRLTKDVVEYIKKTGKAGAIMLADFTKAFDVLDIQFLNLCLEKYNFGKSFRQWVSVLYTDIVSSVTVNGWISKSFNIGRGIRQGCPLSALLFVLAAEFLANKVRCNRQIKPIEIKEYNFHLKLLQYADDTLFFVQDENSLQEILLELQVFGDVAGPKLNKDKTSMLWLGNMSKAWDVTKYALKWTETPMKYLGHYIYYNASEAQRIEWEEKITKIKKLLNNWSRRNLTIFGRVTILKCLALSQIIHLMIVDSIPLKYFKTIENLIYKFIWKKKNEKIKRSVLTENYEKGGIKMIDIDNQLLSFRLKWLGRFLNGNLEMWKIMFSYWFDKLGGITLLLNCNFDISTLKILDDKRIPVFYKEILRAWESVRASSTVKDIHIVNNEPSDVLKQIVWHNKHVLFGNQSLFYQDWYDSGIIFFRDFVKEDGYISVENIFKKIALYKSKGTVIFDYAKLKSAIPTVWFNQVRRENVVHNRDRYNLSVPSFVVTEKERHISDLSSNIFYRLIPSKNTLTNKCCLYWESKLDGDIDWANVFKKILFI